MIIIILYVIILQYHCRVRNIRFVIYWISATSFRYDHYCIIMIS